MGRNRGLPVPVLKAGLKDKASPTLWLSAVVLPPAKLPTGKQKPGTRRGRCQLPDPAGRERQQPCFWACKPRDRGRQELGEELPLLGFCLTLRVSRKDGEPLSILKLPGEAPQSGQCSQAGQSSRARSLWPGPASSEGLGLMLSCHRPEHHDF